MKKEKEKEKKEKIKPLVATDINGRVKMLGAKCGKTRIALPIYDADDPRKQFGAPDRRAATEMANNPEKLQKWAEDFWAAWSRKPC